MTFPEHALRIAQDPSLHDADHFTALGDPHWYHVGTLRTYLKETNMNAYESHLSALREQHEEQTRSSFERDWQATRVAALEAEREAAAIDEPQPRALSADERARLTPPDPYRPALERLRAHNALKDAVKGAWS
jgi:hypothetical protein